MTDEAAAVRPSAAPAPALGARVRAGVRRPDAWWQLLRFGVVGASGYVVNLSVFALAVHGAGMPYQVAAALAFLVAVSNNFLWNRRWTFRAHEHEHVRAHHQAARFLVVSGTAFFAGLGLLTVLVEIAGLPEVPAQAIAIVVVMPLSFVANKLWSFRA
jgi:dolichol-phosphate mannosyltransferase